MNLGGRRIVTFGWLYLPIGSRGPRTSAFGMHIRAAIKIDRHHAGTIKHHGNFNSLTL